MTRLPAPAGVAGAPAWADPGAGATCRAGAVAWQLLALLAACETGAVAQPVSASWPAGAAACASCHAAPGTQAPRLAGLPAYYLVKQLRDLRDGERSADAALQAAHTLDRDAARRVAQAWSAAPVASWPRSGSAVGQMLYEQGHQGQGRPACQVCHGNAAGLAPGMSAPPPQGQPASYLVRQLRAWRDGSRRNSPEDLMTEAARGLTEADIDALARHLAAP